MSDFKTQLKEIKNARKNVSKAENALYLKKLAVHKKRTPTSLGEIREDIKVENKSLIKTRKALADAIKQFHQKDHQELTAELNADYPILLLPLRIETRFVKTGRTQELLVRIYPDDIHIHNHEPILTEKELEKGRVYWTSLVKANRLKHADVEELKKQKEDKKKAAWAELLKESNTQRSLWVAKETKPSNWTFDFSAAPAAMTFPEHSETKTHSWTTAPRTQLLPNRFVVTIYKSKLPVFRQEGNTVPDTVFTGPDPFLAEEAFDKDDENETIKFGDDFAWITDFNRAEKIGLAMRIRINSNISNKGKIDKLTVTGILSSATPEEGQELLEQMVDNHHYSSKGFSFLPQGTATNNTNKKGSDYKSNADEWSKGYYDGSEVIDFNSNKTLDGSSFAKALGINHSVLQEVINADMQEGENAKAINTALYPATLGRFFEVLLKPVIPKHYHSQLEEFFVEYVSARGILPALRVGDQPYGILVTSDLKKWAEQKSANKRLGTTDFRFKLSKVLNKLQKKWDLLAKEVSHVGKSGNPDELLLDILGLQAGSVSFSTRVGIKASFVQTLSELQTEYTNEVQSLQGLLLDFFKELGYVPGDNKKIIFPHIAGIQFQMDDKILPKKNYIDKGKKSRKDAFLSKIGNTKKNYIECLADMKKLSELENHTVAGNKMPNSLLYLLLHYSMLQELSKKTEHLYDKFNISAKRETFSKSHINFSKQTPDLTSWELLKGKPSQLEVQGLNINKPIAQHFLELPTNQPDAIGLNAVKKALRHLSGLDTDTLEECLSNHIDLCSYRLDAWQTALINKRLADKRSKNPKGLYIGAYGILTDLLPDNKQIVSRGIPDKLKPRNGEKLYKSKSNGGFVHTPSLNHATAAGLMMSGYVNNADDTDSPDAFAVNISSDRVRRAKKILEGVQNEQSLEELLGYQFERGLHDITSSGVANLNKYLYEFRDKFTIDADSISQKGSVEAQEVFQVSNTVNGVKLSETKKSVVIDIVTDGSALTKAKKKDIELIWDEIDKLKDSVDAINDLLVSESVYQVTQGNFDRTSGVLNSIRHAQRPPETEVEKTPRSTLFTYTNRISLHFEGDGSPVAGGSWSKISSPRSVAEPGLNKWLGKIIGNSRRIYMEVVQQDEEGNELQPQMFTLSNLRLQPIDLVYIVGADYEGGATELESRIADLYRKSEDADVEAKNSVKIYFNPDNLDDDEGLSFARIFPLIRYLRLLITSSRAAHAKDFAPLPKTKVVNSSADFGWMVNELEERVNSVLNLLQETQTVLSDNAPNEIAEKNNDNPATFADLFALYYAEGETREKWDKLPSLTEEAKQVLISYQEEASKFGIATAYPDNLNLITQQSSTDLLTKTAGIWNTIETRIRLTAEKLNAAQQEQDENPSRLLLEKGMKVLLGEEFTVIPCFKYTNKIDLEKSFKEKGKQLLKHATKLRNTRQETIMDTWVQSLSQVRPNIALWEKVGLLYDAFNDKDLNLQPVQVPFRKKDSWLSVEFPEVHEGTKDRFDILDNTVAIAVHGDTAAKIENLQCALLIDEWTETIPVEDEITGVSFNYNQPNATSPNTLLLAVEPSNSKKWSWSMLENIIEDTFNRAKSRAVEPAQIKQDPVLNTLLPMTVADFDLNNSNVSLDFLTVDDIFLNSLNKNISTELYRPFFED